MVTGYAETHGERHTATLDAKYGLAILLQQRQSLISDKSKAGGGGGKPQLTGMAKVKAEKEARELYRQQQAECPDPRQKDSVAAVVPASKDDPGRVRALYEQVVAGYTAQLGGRHTETLRAQYNLALVLKQVRRRHCWPLTCCLLATADLLAQTTSQFQLSVSCSDR